MNVTGTSNLPTINATTGNIVTGVVTTLSGTTATYATGNLTTLNATTGNIVTGVVTTISGTNLTYTNANVTGIVTATGGIRVGAAGSIGIGTTNPTAPLTIFSTDIPQLKLNVSADGIRSEDLRTNNTNTFNITNKLNITPWPSTTYSLLHLGVTDSSDTSTGGIRIHADGNVGGSNRTAIVLGAFYVGLTELNAVTIRGTGLVGIGSADPTSKLDVGGNVKIVGIVTASQFVRSGGTSSQFLKADGSVDSSTYLTSYTETDTLNSVTTRGNVTSNGISVGLATVTQLVIGTGVTLTSGGLRINSGIITASQFVRSGGTSSQFLKADGSVDSSTYLTSYTETDTLDSVTTRGRTTSNGISVGVLTATSFIKSGGTSSQFLKADGSVDSSTYSGQIEVREEGTQIGTAATTFNFVGAGVTAAYNAGITTITISGGGGGGSGAPGGSDTQVQFNDGGSTLGGDSGLTYNKTTDTLSVTGGVNVGTGVTILPSGIRINTGIVTAQSFVGDGSGLTGVGFALTVGTRTAGVNNNDAVSNVKAIRFAKTPFSVTDLGSGEVLIQSESTFNPWYVNGQGTLKATGEEPIEFIAGPGIAITTKAVASAGIGTTFSKAITFNSVPSGSDTQIQFNDGGSTFGGDSGLTYNKTTDILSVTGGVNVGTGGTIITTTESGNLGIGTVNPQGKLQVGAAGTSVFVITGIGSVGIGTTNPRTRLEIDGILGFKNTNVRIGNRLTGGSSGSENILIGNQTGSSLTSGSTNILIGYLSGSATSNKTGNIYIGSQSGFENNGNYNTYLGDNSGYNALGDYNTYLGSWSGDSSGSRRIVIGSGNASGYFDAPNITQNNQFAIGIKTDANPSKYWLVGNENFNIGIGTTNPTSKLHVQGDVLISGIVTASSFVKSGGTSSQFLKADGSVDSSTYLTTTGNGVNLTGIVTSIVAGTNVTISGSTGQVTINASGGGGGSTGIGTTGGNGSNIRSLSGTHLVSYASQSDFATSAQSISGVSTYTQIGILTASTYINFQDNFGKSVATSADGKTIVVGAWQDEDPNASASSGAVHVFDRVGNSFIRVGVLTGLYAVDADDKFGLNVATSADGKTIVVGTDADEYPGSGGGSGVVYVFDRVTSGSTTVFNPVGVLTGTNASDSLDKFGSSLSCSADGNTLVVGAYQDELPEHSNQSTGLVYVFDRIGESYSQTQILSGPDILSYGLGYAVNVTSDGKTIFAGTDDRNLIHVFDRVGAGNTFQEIGTFSGSVSTSSNLDRFGRVIVSSADGRTILAATPFEEVGAASDTGLVYIFDRVGNTFNEVGILTGVYSSQASDLYGESTAISADGKTIVIGAQNDEIGATTSTGVVYVYKRLGNTFNQVGILTGSSASTATDRFGTSVAISADGKSIIVGAVQDETTASTNHGTVYVFDEVKETYLYSAQTGNIGIGTTNPTSKLHVSGGANIVGTVTATSFVGDGSGLTNLPSAGASLTVQEEGTNVGTAATTLNFVGSGVTATYSGGTATITISGGGGGGTPGGSDTQIQFNDGGSTFGGDSGLTYNKTTDTLTVAGNTIVSGLTTTNHLYVVGVGTFASAGFKIRSSDNISGGEITFATSAQTGIGRTITIPVLAANNTLNLSGTNNQWNNDNTFTGNFTYTGINFDIQTDNPNPQSTISIGGIGQTGTIILGRSTKTQIVSIQAGASGVGTTKTINLGTGGLSGSFTQINIGPTSGVGTVVINSGTNLGIGTTNPQQKLDVYGGNIALTDAATASKFIGFYQNGTTLSGFIEKNGNNLTISNETAGTMQFGNNGSTRLRIDSAGNVLVAAATSTGTASQTLQVTGGAYVSENLGIGTTNPTSKLHVIGNTLIVGVVTAKDNDLYTEWTLGSNGSSDYTFTGPGFTGSEYDPTIYLIRGKKYRFTNTMGAHPFRIQSTPNGSTGTQYNDGITNNDVSNGTLTWEVRHNAPSTLYYQCTAHGAMGGVIYILNEGAAASLTVQEEGSNVGTAATTLNFVGAGVTATYSGGTATITISGGGGGGGGTPGGSDTQIQFNDGGSTFGGDAGLTYNKTTDVLSVTGGVNVGTGVTILPSGLRTNSGIVTASSFSGSGSNLTGLTGASAATYGSSTNVPQIVVDANGRITSITNVAVSGGGGTPGGSDTQIQFNDGGSTFGGDSGLTYNKTTDTLTVAGGIIVTGVVTATDFNSSSDITLKNNVRTIENPLAKVMSIRGVNFEWKESGQSSAGVLAQEIEKIMPELVRNSTDNIKSVNYNGLIGLLIEVVKEQQNQINELKSKLS